MWRDYPCDLLLFCAMTEAPPNPLPLCRRSIYRLLAQHSGSAPLVAPVLGTVSGMRMMMMMMLPYTVQQMCAGPRTLTCMPNSARTRSDLNATPSKPVVADVFFFCYYRPTVFTYLLLPEKKICRQMFPQKTPYMFNVRVSETRRLNSVS